MYVQTMPKKSKMAKSTQVTEAGADVHDMKREDVTYAIEPATSSRFSILGRAALSKLV